MAAAEVAVPLPVGDDMDDTSIFENKVSKQLFCLYSYICLHLILVWPRGGHEILGLNAGAV